MAWDPGGDIHLCTLQEGCIVTTLLTQVQEMTCVYYGLKVWNDKMTKTNRHMWKFDFSSTTINPLPNFYKKKST